MNPQTKQRLPLTAAAQLFSELLRCLCSAAWADKILHRLPQSAEWQFEAELYPPGQHQTSMRECIACRRVCPPNGDKPECVDCEVERQQEVMREMIIEAECEVVSPNLAQRHWRHSTSVADLANEPHAAFDSLAPPGDPGADVTSNGTPRNDLYTNGLLKSPSKPRDVNQRDQIDWLSYSLGIPSRAKVFYDPIPRSSLSQLPQDVASEVIRIAEEHDGCFAEDSKAVRRAFRRACKPLGDFKIKSWRSNIILKYGGRQYCLLRFRHEYRTRSVSVESGHSASCQVTTLAEKSEELKKEISDFKKRGKVARSAKRFTVCNPFSRRRAPEDHLSVKQCFVTRDRDRKRHRRKPVAAE